MGLNKRWIACTGLFFVLMFFMSRISAWGDIYDPAPYRILFEGLTVLLWVRGLYLRWTGRWTREGQVAWGIFVLFLALPHIPFSLIGAGSWVSLGGSLILGTAAILRAGKGQ